MKNKIYPRLAAGLLCAALLFSDAASLNVWAVSDDLNTGQIVSVVKIDEEEENTESALTEETDEENTESPAPEVEAPEGDDAPVIEGGEESSLPDEEAQESAAEEEPPSISENAMEEEQDSVSENTTEEEANVNSVMTASEEIIAGGTSNDISWEIDTNGKLTVNGTGDFERIDVGSGRRGAPWYSDKDSIKTAEIDVVGITDASYMFFDCSNLISIEFKNFDTSEVTDMSGMFYCCRNLTKLDLSKFNTGNVTNMNWMFSYCENLPTLDLSNFDTGKVTKMSCMFDECFNLTTLDLSSFNTANVANMSFMFTGCKNLTTLDVSNFNIGKVTNMGYMFSKCASLTTLDLRSFNTANVTDMYGMFIECKNLTTLNISNFNTGKVTNMGYMFSGCSNLNNLNLGNFDVGSVTNMIMMFSDCESLTDIYTPRNVKRSVELPSKSGDKWYRSDGTVVTELPKNLNNSIVLKKNSIPPDIVSGTSNNISWIIDAEGHLTVSGTGDFERTDGKYAPWYDNRESIKTAEIDLFEATRNASYMFTDCTNLTELDLSSFTASAVTDMSSMFSGCTSLTTLDLRDFNTGSVTNMSSMFSGCKNLTTLDLSNFDTGSVTDMFDFNGCENLTDIYTPLNLKHSVILPSANEAKWYRSDGSVLTELPKNLNYSVVLKKNETPSNIASGTSGKISWVIDADRKLTVSGSGDLNGWAPWLAYNDSIRTAVVTVTDMTDASDIFCDCYYLTSIDLKSFDTSKVTYMGRMFHDCKSLSELDLSNFNTGSVTDMNAMFDGCESLTTLDLSSFDTGNVTDMNCMFDGCKSLTELDVRNFNTGKVTDMSFMFRYCGSLTTLDLSSFDVGYVTDMNDMLSVCPFLSKINTPRNVKQIVDLPTNSAGIKWYLPDGTVVTILPQNLDYSVVLSIIKPNSDPKDDDGVLDEDIPEDGVIPNGLWISGIADQTYTGTAIKPEVRIYNGKKRLKQGTDYTLSYQNNTKAAQSGDTKPPTVVVKGKGNYSGPENQTFTITKRNISDTYVTKTFTDAYASLENGNNPKLVFNAKCNNKALKKNTDYTLTVKNSAGNEVTSYGAAGTYTAVVKGTGNFTGEYSFSFEVLNKVPVSKLKIGKIPAVNFDGTRKTPEPVIKYGKKTLTKDTDYSLNYQNNTAIGTATIEITGMGDYFGTRNVTFSITGLQIKKAKFTGFVKSFPYTGDELRQTSAVLKYGDEELKEGRDYTVSYSDHRNKGKAAVTYTGIGKYTGSIKKTYNITAYNIAADTHKRIKLSTDTISAVYAKGGAKPSLKVYDGTLLLTEGKDYTLSYQNNAAVTTPTAKKQPTITVKGKGNYTGTLSEKKTFIITAKNIAEAAVTAPDVATSKKIGKYKSTPVLTDSNGKKLKAGTDYDKAYTYTYKTTTEKVLNNETEVTRYAGDPVDAKDIVPANTVLCVRIKAKEGSNYTGETTAEYRIVTSLLNKAKITVQNPAQNNKNLFPYTGQAIRLDKSNLTVKVGKNVLSDDQYEIIEDTYKNNVSKGTASVQIRGVGNYGGTATVKFKIGTKGFQWFQRLFG